MRVWFIQGFTREIKVFYEVGGNRLVGFTTTDDVEVTNLPTLIRDTFTEKVNITEVVLQGHSKKLKEIETYFKEKEEVNVKWL